MASSSADQVRSGEPHHDGDRLERRDLLAIASLVGISLFFDIFVVFYIGNHNGNYFIDYHTNLYPDSIHYVMIGHNVLRHARFSRADSPPFAPDMLRTPVYPLFAGGLEITGGPLAIYLAQGALRAASSGLLFLLARRGLGFWPAGLAGLVFATDLMLAISDFEALTEPLFNFLVIASSFCLLTRNDAEDSSRGGWGLLLAGSLLLSVAVLTRPAALYLFVIFALVKLIRGEAGHSVRREIRQVLVMFVALALPLGLWAGRNYMIFSLPKLSHVDNINFTYFVAAGAYQVHHGVSAETAREMIRDEYDLPSFVDSYNEWEAGRSVAEIDAALKAAWPRAVRKYPGALVASSLLGIAKSTVSHNVGSLAGITRQEWVAPQTGAMLSLDPAATRRLLGNPPGLIAAFAWQMAHLLITLAGVCVGLAWGWRRAQDRRFLLAVAGVLAYFYLTVALFGPDAYSRCRAPVLPFLDIFAGLGLATLLNVGDGPRPAGSQMTSLPEI